MEVNSTIVNLNVINSEEANLVQDVKHIVVSNDTCDIPPDKLKLRDVYFACLYPQLKPTCVQSWEGCFKQIRDLNDMFQVKSSFVHNHKSLDIQYKYCIEAV